MRKRLTILFFIPLFTFLVSCQNQANQKKIGVIIPIQYTALDEIVDGFRKALSNQYHGKVMIKTANAQGDPNLLRTIVQQMQNENFDLFVPIGSTATEMTLGLVRQRPVISLASTLSQTDRLAMPVCHVSVVHDEISPRKLLRFIQTLNPSLKEIVLVHSPTDKIYRQVQTLIKEAKSLDMAIEPRMIQNLTELYSVTNALPDKTQALLVLKDPLIASGIATLVQVAQKKRLPLITADQGTVKDGATMSLGVKEQDIGKKGAILAAAILSDQKPCALPIQELSSLYIFVNQEHLASSGLSLNAIKKTAQRLHYPMMFVKHDA